MLRCMRRRLRVEIALGGLLAPRWRLARVRLWFGEELRLWGRFCFRRSQTEMRLERKLRLRLWLLLGAHSQEWLCHWQRWLCHWQRWLCHWQRWLCHWQRWLCHWQQWLCHEFSYSGGSLDDLASDGHIQLTGGVQVRAKQGQIVELHATI